MAQSQWTMDKHIKRKHGQFWFCGLKLTWKIMTHELGKKTKFTRVLHHSEEDNSKKIEEYKTNS